jgi:hypothetical protein
VHNNEDREQVKIVVKYLPEFCTKLGANEHTACEAL